MGEDEDRVERGGGNRGGLLNRQWAYNPALSNC